MELIDKDLKEIEKLSPPLKKLILSIFESPYYTGYKALRSQFNAYCKELTETPFTIEGNIDISKYEELENIDKIIFALSGVARAKAETSLKISKEIPDMADSVENLRLKLTKGELADDALRVQTAKDLKKDAFG